MKIAKGVVVHAAWAVALLLVLPAGVTAAPGSTAPLGKGICKPNCRGKTCGSNGCGGRCGTCRKGSACFKNRCVTAPKGDPCVAMTGQWTGIMPATSKHAAEYLQGRIWGTVRSCRARFAVSYSSRGRKVKVIEYFKVTLRGPKTRRRARFVCTRLTHVTPGIRYSKDTFTGTMNINLTRFKGTVRDTSASTSPVILKKK
jgi:hypothetical protein